MRCNIDQKGRAVRLIWGIVMLLLAAAAVAAGFLGTLHGGWAAGAAVLFAALGAFGIYESRKGWCAVRAMGFKTPV